jgi:asparagine synthase (glutamine-hydrolysing)
MCGLAGILRLCSDSAPARTRPLEHTIPEAWLDALDASIRHRGPDGQGRFRDRAISPDGRVVDIALVHRRLSIIDHQGGAQPMLRQDEQPLATSPGPPLPPARLFHGTPHASTDYRPVNDGRADGRPRGLLAAVFNGCVYNHRVLRHRLQARGHRFQSHHSDTEVIPHAYAEWGEAAFDHLDAMAAIALWDRARASLLLHRDRAGEKPLYVWSSVRSPGLLAFASGPGGLLHLAAAIDGPKAIAPEAAWLRPWLGLGFASTSTPWPEIIQLPPGALMDLTSPRRVVGTVGGSGPAAQAPVPARWESTPELRGVGLTETSRLPAAADNAERFIAAAVQRRLDADVPVACLLSGGVDSSLVAHFAARANPSVQSVCVRLPGAGFDESPIAAQIASIIGIRHHTVDASAAEPVDDLIALVRHAGLPFADSSLLPTLWASRAAGSVGRVQIGGDGGDELFLGYQRYAAAGWLGRAALPAWLAPVSLCPRRDPRGRWDKLARFILAARRGRYTELLAIFQQPDLTALAGPGAPAGPAWDDLHEPRSPADAREHDLAFYLPGDLMRKVDTASMHVPVEARSPLLDPDLVAAAPAITAHAGYRKQATRALAKRFFPAELIDRPKMGFALPIGRWFREDHAGLGTLLRDRLTSPEPFGGPGLGINLHQGFIRRLLDEHLGTGPSGLVKRDHSQRLYLLLVLSLWAEHLGQIARAAHGLPADPLARGTNT